MELKIWFEEKPGIVCVQIIGQITLNDFKSILTETSVLMNKKRSNHLLVLNIERHSKIRFFDIYDLPNLYSRLKVSREARYAIVVSDDIDAYRAECLQFFEKVSTNAGYALKVFDDESVARKWLFESQASIHPGTNPPHATVPTLTASALLSSKCHS